MEKSCGIYFKRAVNLTPTLDPMSLTTPHRAKLRQEFWFHFRALPLSIEVNKMKSIIKIGEWRHIDVVWSSGKTSRVCLGWGGRTRKRERECESNEENQHLRDVTANHTRKKKVFAASRFIQSDFVILNFSTRSPRVFYNSHQKQQKKSFKTFSMRMKL